MDNVRRCFAIAAILIGGIAIGTPDNIIVGGITVAKMLIAISTALNSVSLYLLKEQAPAPAEATPQ